MKGNQDFSPAYKKVEFICPHCGKLSYQKWDQLYIIERERDFNFYQTDVEPAIDIASCDACSAYSLWIAEAMIYPLGKDES